MQSMDFKTIDYLRCGTPKQRLVHQSLTDHAILTHLAPYDPIVVGTIPLDLDIDDSDVDILLQSDDLPSLAKHLHRLFSNYTAFHLRVFDEEPRSVLICHFAINGLPFELYATNQETVNQMAYLHLLKEYEILQKEGALFAAKVRKLKQQGVKTEAAFCDLLNLSGDPYQALLAYKC